MRASTLSFAFSIALASFVAPAVASAHAGGWDHVNCNGCHSGGGGTTNANVTFSSPRIVGMPVTVTVTVSNGSESAAGFNLRMANGTFANPPGTNAQRWTTSNEATHTTPTASMSWTMTWTPSSAGNVGWGLWANAVNSNGSDTGDRPLASEMTGSVVVQLQNGSFCGSSGDCVSGHCVDGVCCNSACSGTCQACTPSAGGSGPAGTCSNLVPDSAGCCPAGFRWDGSSCQEINECAGANDCCVAGSSGICDGSATCVNTSGSYGCDCATGFAGDGHNTSSGCTACAPGTTTFGSDQFCSNIDECATASCGPGTCVEIPLASWAAPGFVCMCDPGYEQVDSPIRTCVDVDECARGTDDCTPEPAGICTNTIGSFDCACATPAFVGTTGRDCVDYDECGDAMYTSFCSSEAHCVNGFGTWDCVCNTGFEGDGRTCTDIDECARDLDECDVNATCTNTIGAYTCTCNAGWEGTGVFCSDVDECATGTGGCGLGEVCVNQVGAANLCNCEPGRTRTADDQPCLIVCGDSTRGAGEGCDDANAADGDGCSATCQIEPGWACREPAPFGTSTCMNTCGNGLIDPVEDCDDGAANSDTTPDACRTTCVAAHCGDAVLDTGEGCDDGASNDDSAENACRTTCDPAYCGDGVVDQDEVCDPGGGVPGAQVAGTCTTLCSPDAGIDPSDPPRIVGGAGCSASNGPASPFAWSLALLALALFRARRRT